jgi:trehalose 6-phosphate phosphatase
MPSMALSVPPGDALSAPPPVRAADIALFADLDGTLAPLESTPDKVRPDRHRRRLLDALARALKGRLAIVSGRSLEDLDRLLEGRIPALAALHGLVRRTAEGRVVESGDEAATQAAVTTLRDFARSDRRLLVEDKGKGASLHYRRAPETAEACVDLIRRLASAHGLAVQQGDMVVELRAPGPHKGEAVEAFLREAPFAGKRPIFIGDDLTDEDGFRAARRAGGFGVIVGPRRPTEAQYALADVAEAQAWLRHLAGYKA